MAVTLAGADCTAPKVRRDAGRYIHPNDKAEPPASLTVPGLLRLRKEAGICAPEGKVMLNRFFEVSGRRNASTSSEASFLIRLRRSLGHRFGDVEGWEIERVSRRGRPGRERSVYRAHDPATGRIFGVKANANLRANWQQYRALRNLRRHTPDCVTPLYLAADCRFFVMEWIDAAPLLARLPTAGPKRMEALTRAGAWLAHLHSATRGSPPLGSRRHTVRLLPLFSRGSLGQAAAGLAARLRRLPLRSGPVAMLHGDFQPGNLFDMEDRLVAFDRQSDRYGVAFFDAAWFLSHLADGRERAASKGQPWPGEEEADRRAFFSGYGPVRERDLALFDLVEDLVLFSRWRYQVRRNNARLDEQVRRRGLLDPEGPVLRPGRLVAAPEGRSWTGESRQHRD